MARLIVLNGPPGCGKSTLARMFVDDHPMALDLDLDVVRDLIGRWIDAPDAGLAARRLGLAMAREHLAADRDVIIPQYLARVEFLDQLGQLAAEVAAGLIEIVLLPDRATAISQFEARIESPDRVHRSAQELVQRAGGISALRGMYDALISLVESRPTIVITPGEDLPATYEKLLSAVGGPQGEQGSVLRR